MKNQKRIIIFGLGVFGSALAAELTRLGHDVIGVDSNLHKVEENKEHLTDCICMLTSDSHALKALPLHEVDLCIVAFGADFGLSIQTIALLKQMGVNKIAARCTTPLHRSIIEAIGVSDIIYPEMEVAENYANRIDSGLIEGLYIIDDNHRIFEINVPSFLSGRSLEEIDFEGNFELKLITIKRVKKVLQFNLKSKVEYVALDELQHSIVLTEADRLILFGRLSHFNKMMNSF